MARGERTPNRNDRSSASTHVAQAGALSAEDASALLVQEFEDILGDDMHVDMGLLRRAIAHAAAMADPSPELTAAVERAQVHLVDRRRGYTEIACPLCDEVVREQLDGRGQQVSAHLTAHHLSRHMSATS